MSQEALLLTDTANELRLVSRVPSGKHFTPIGHIALDIHQPDEDEELGLPRSGVVWVHNLYISYALQRGGFGVAAMSKAEQLATLEPLKASIMVLDTVTKEILKNEELQKNVYDDRGLPRPVVSPSFIEMSKTYICMIQSILHVSTYMCMFYVYISVSTFVYITMYICIIFQA